MMEYFLVHQQYSGSTVKRRWCRPSCFIHLSFYLRILRLCIRLEVLPLLFALAGGKFVTRILCFEHRSNMFRTFEPLLISI